MIIDSLLDTDLYKLTMMQVTYHQFRSATAEYRLFKRTEHHCLVPYVDSIQQAINEFCQLRFTSNDIEYLRTLGYFQEDFLSYLINFKPCVEHINLSVVNNELSLLITGPWLETILFEVPLLAIISEIAYRAHNDKSNEAVALERLQQKIQFMKSSVTSDEPFHFIDFGTRRRATKANQAMVVGQLYTALPSHFIGSSNLALAKQLSLKPTGTMAHEYIQACQVLAPDLKSSQHFAFECWLQQYNDKLAIALSDTYSTGAFLRDFNIDLATRYKGVRHDSGDPIKWTQQILSHYKELGIDPKSKTLVYSDSLTFEKALIIFEKFNNQTNLVFGIGTYLTNDTGFKPLDIVIKMTECNNSPVCKISETAAKETCIDPVYMTHLKKIMQ